MDTLITSTQAIEGLRLAVAERGRDYIDPLVEQGECQYVVTGVDGPEPGCIGGTALFKVGVPLTELRRWEGNTIDAMVPNRKTYFFSSNVVDAEGFLTEEAGQVLRVAQDHQDNGGTWGVALDAAETLYRLITKEESR